MPDESSAASLDLTGVLLKLARAQTHLDALKTEVRAYWHRDPYRLLPNLDCEAGKYSLRIEIREAVPVGWSVIVGDFIHNLRSALDHMACQLVLINDPAADIDRTQFPIFTREPVSGGPLNAWERMTAGMHPRALAEIRDMQPYKAGYGAKQHALALLNRLSNDDKHKLLIGHVAAVAPHNPGSIGLVERNNVEITNPEIAVGVPLKDRDEIAWADIRCTGPDPQVDHQGPIPMDIAVRSGPHHVTTQGLVELHEGITKRLQILAAIVTLDV
jgi:hypothetical protein